MNNQIIQPHLLGVNARHAADFVIDRKSDPYGSNLVLAFRSRAVILTVNGVETAQIGDCIIHSVNFPQYHRSVRSAVEGYRNDWIHVLPKTLSPVMKKLRLPYNRLICTGQPEVITRFIRFMQIELLTADMFSDNIITNQLEGMLLAVARGRITARRQVSMTYAERRYFQKFSDLRERVLSDCDHDINVKSLSSQVNLSPERFTTLYRKFFKASPYAELIDARMVKAKRLLLSSCMEIKEISVACGWNDVQYFSRLFKKKTGTSPARFRNTVLS